MIWLVGYLIVVVAVVASVAVSGFAHWAEQTQIAHNKKGAEAP